MVVLIVDGKEYPLNEKQAALMTYVSEAEALENGNVNLSSHRSSSRI